MSEDENTERLLTCIHRLHELSTLRPNDRLHRQYVKYINAFLKPFGNERAYLVGSTAENSKLRWSTDGGDTDYIFVSGKLEVPMENIQYRKGMEDYIWIKIEGLKHKHFGDDRLFLSPKILKAVSPHLFTLLRAVYVTVTAINIFSAGRVSTAMQSKVGLAIEEYDNLEIDNDHFRRVTNVRRDMARSQSFTLYLKERWTGLEVNPVDKKLLFRILRIVSTTQNPGLKGKYGSFVDIVATAIQRPAIEEAHNKKISLSDCVDTHNSQYKAEIFAERMRATYTDKSSTDFVPALRVVGILPCIKEFIGRVKFANWPGAKLAEEIYNTDIFIVSRLAPVSPDEEKDFRLSFNLPECLLVENFPPGAKVIFLILKSFVKGTIRRKLSESNLKSKLKSYHMKTLMFWMCEKEEIDFWKESNRLTAVRSTLRHLQSCLKVNRLEHYFLRSNLFVDFDDCESTFLSECMEVILQNPIKSIEAFFEMDKEVKSEVWLSPEEVFFLKDIKEDEGRCQAVDKLEDAIVDFVRGCNDSPKDEDGNAPIKEAVLNLLDVFFDDEQAMDTKGNAVGYPVSNPGSETRLVANLMNLFVTAGGNQSYDSKKAGQKLDILVGLGSLFSGGQKFLRNIGGKDGLQRVLQSTNDAAYVHRQQLRLAVQRLLNCGDEEEERASLELKQEITAYFLSRD